MCKFAVYAGHGGSDPGAVSGSRQEKNYTLAVMKETTRLLQDAGHTVINNRITDTERSISADAVKANSAGVDAVISIHLNSNAGTPGTGCEAYYISGNSKGKNLAEKICTRIEALGLKNRGAKTGTFSILTKTNATAVLVETAFINNDSDMRLYDTGKMGDAIAAAIIELFGSESSKAPQTGYTKILGTAIATAGQMQTYLKSVNPNATSAMLALPDIYLAQGKTEGIRGDIAFAQSCLETGNFKFEDSAVTFSQNNFCGMGVTANGMKGNSFPKPEEGVLAQIQHLKGYATTAALNSSCVDPRYKYIDPKGCAPYVEWLGQKENPEGKGWATGASYGNKILTILNNIASGSTGSDTGSETGNDNGRNTSTTPSFMGQIKIVQTWMNDTYYADLVADGIYGTKTKAALVKAFQTWLNETYRCGLAVDGIFGSRTRAAIRNIRCGDNSTGVKILQAFLFCNKCNPQEFTGRFNTDTETAVKEFQKSKGLSADGIAGTNTWTALLK